jgi:uncharacterized membrane protein
MLLWERYQGIIIALVLSNVVSVGFLLSKMWSEQNSTYSFLLWNLMLALLPLCFSFGLIFSLAKRRWLSWQNITLSVLWLLFLPNSFYLSSDLVHLRDASQANVLFDIVLLLSFSFNGFITGMISLYLIHRELYRRFWASQVHILIGLVLLASSFAIYLGRNLRWNTWDVLVHPAGLVFDVSDRLINPTAHPQALTTTLGFFVLLGSIYIVLWQFAQVLERK